MRKALLLLTLLLQQKPTDEWLTRPVDDKTFRTYLDFFKYERNLPFNPRTIGVEEQDGIRKEHISFDSTPGVRVFANLYRPTTASAQASPAAILLHGGTGRGKDTMRRPAELLSRGGFTVLSIDMQFFGERSTDLMTSFTEPEKHERLYNQQAVYLAWVTQTVKDVSRSVDFLVQNVGVSEKRIGLLGISRGAIVASIAGAVERRIGAVSLLYTGHFDALETGHLAAACPANYIGRISPRPLMMVNGLNDTDMIRETSVLPMFRLAKMPKEIIWEDGGHGMLSEGNQVKTLHWLQEKLK
jgi:dienelactone hydrolase